jgi:hypothetical protein
MNPNIKYALPVIAAILTFSVTAQESALEPTKDQGDARSVAWYVANIREAMAMNKECYGNNGTKELQATPNCANSLQALKISHLGNN